MQQITEKEFWDYIVNGHGVGRKFNVKWNKMEKPSRLIKVGIWIPVIGLWFMWRQAMSDKVYSNIHQYTIAGLLQIPYTVVVVLIYIIKYKL